ncbi:hypothetical protein RDI58_001812 [Solanum bulbocastanum]|uniref:Uncharacterized protein n=1 Tax=Solanum bulbocastanum TaxID=147425 RepID=A0AAN8YNG8_SOLBU
MQTPHPTNDGSLDNEEDENMENQVVPQIPTRDPSSFTPSRQTPIEREGVPNILEQLIQPILMMNPLTIEMPQNIEKKFLIRVPKEVTKTSLNIRYYNSLMIPKYVLLAIPTMNCKQPVEVENATIEVPMVNLEMSLNPGGSSNAQEVISMKILMWNCRGAHNANITCVLY